VARAGLARDGARAVGGVFVSPRSFEVHLMLFQGLGAAQVGARLGLNENQVHKARARVLAKVRELVTRIGVEAPTPGSTRP
jgi:DNA-binding CsgD family transcriptional regulator